MTDEQTNEPDFKLGSCAGCDEDIIATDDRGSVLVPDENSPDGENDKLWHSDCYDKAQST